MKKKVISMMLAILILVGILPFRVSAATTTNDKGAVIGSFSNGSDYVVYGDKEYYSNLDAQDYLYVKTGSDHMDTLVLEEHVISMLISGDILYLLVYQDSSTSALYALDLKTHETLPLLKFDGLVSSISMRDHVLYLLKDGMIETIDFYTNERTVLLASKRISLFYISNYDILKFKTADSFSTHLQSYRFSDGTIMNAPTADTSSQTVYYTPRTTAPAKDNPYYTTLNIFHRSGYGMDPNIGNCTCYAFGRSYENLGTEPRLSHGNAGKWYDYNKSNGYYPYGSSPVLGAVAVWKSNTAGHVAVVEVIDGDTVITSESGWKSFYFKTVTRKKSHSNFSASSYYSFQGFIYVLGTDVTDQRENTVPLDINGYLDGNNCDQLNNYGTFDVWVNGALVADNVNDYCAQWPVGSSYEITDVQGTDIHKYLGVREGTLTGTIGTDGTQVRLQFRTLDSVGDDFYAFVVNKHTNRCVFNQGDQNITGHPMQDCPEAIWHFERQENGTYKITSAKNGLTLDVHDYGNTPGTNIHACSYTGNTAQQWCVFEENGWCSFSAACTPCVMYEDGTTTNIQMMNDTGSDAQWFQLRKIEASYPYNVNGFAFGAEIDDIQGYGTFDVWLDGTLAADNVTDFHQNLNIGTFYEIKDIRSSAGHSYNGVKGGTLSGVISSAPVWTVLDFSEPQLDGIGEPAGVMVLDGRKYAYYPDQVSWFAANAFCRKQGGHLVTITNDAESSVVQSLCGENTIWLGASDAASEGNWTWVTGEPFEYSRWKDGEPNNASANVQGCENYAISHPDGWNDIFGIDSHGFICEFEPVLLDVQGYLDGQLHEDLSGYGTFDVYINGNCVANDVNDYAQRLPHGSAYEIRDIRPADGYTYNGLHSGVRFGTVSSTGNAAVLNFSKITAAEIDVPAEEVVWNGHRYVYFSIPVTWYTAKTICEELGGHMATITSPEENEAIRALCGSESVWLGGSDSETEGVWKWITGESFEYENWRTGTSEPNNAAENDEGCENYAASDVDGWNDVHGCHLIPFVCEFEDDVRVEIASGWSGALTWTLTDDGILTFSGEGKMKDYTYKSEMPWYTYRDQIVQVILEDGIASIGAYAFYGMPALESIRIPTTVTTIGDYAFKNAPGINGVVLPDSLTQLGESAFYACTGLTSIEIPSALYTVKPYTFKNCTNLTAVQFNEGNLQKISDGAFYNTSLTELVLPDCLDILDVYAFKNCANLASIELGDGLTELREAVFYGTAISTIDISEGITKIGPYAFKNCEKLRTIDLPVTLTVVDEASFYACTALERLDLPDAVTKIGNYAFRKCISLTDVQFGSGLTNIGESAFYGCDGLIRLAIPDMVTTIQAYAFKGCTALEILDLPDSLNTLGDSAFHTCTSLSEITIPGNVTGLGEYCFSGCIDITCITFTGDAPAIGSGAFSKLTATACYPDGNTTWNSTVRQNYGGSITWVAQ